MGEDAGTSWQVPAPRCQARAVASDPSKWVACQGPQKITVGAARGGAGEAVPAKSDPTVLTYPSILPSIHPSLTYPSVHVVLQPTVRTQMWRS